MTNTNIEQSVSAIAQAGFRGFTHHAGAMLQRLSEGRSNFSFPHVQGAFLGKGNREQVSGKWRPSIALGVDISANWHGWVSGKWHIRRLAGG